ncbi:uncharacterized protein LOC126887424 isoform X5 [Diabrotica virgifera virgifera]|uniref:Guanylate kinase-like domain-containing protein n=1 Tax=Diabrotica virgifera virgifera TaxID=50390 RepID=A0ABM5KL33_DIAVI|nr:uncharacterized protein LOC126887424 isoform X5 [Diabrotica virgifera virgifera]
MKQRQIRHPIKLHESLINYYASPAPSIGTPDIHSEVYSDSLEDSSCSESSDIVVDELSSDIHKLLWDPWSRNRFSKNPWSDKERPHVRINRYKDMKLTPVERAGKLSRRAIASCLTYLEKSPYDQNYALCKCQLNDKTLIDISEIRRYHYIQYLNIAHNFIVTLEPLSEMPFLQYLDASFNSIEQAFDFSPPLYLTTVNYSGNKIVHIPNLKRFWSIVHLNMSYNKIREIRGLQRLKLNLTENIVANTPHFQKMCLRTFPRLQSLNDNQVTAEQKVEACTKEGVNPIYTSHVCRTQLLLLDTLQKSNIGPQVFPYDQPPPNVIAVIGPPASRKTITINNFFEEYGRIQLGVSHTSRKKRPSEIDGKNYYFIEKEEFVDMIKRAEFISATEFNGSHYGITHKELVKGIDSIVIFLCDLKTALTLKISGVNIKLVLALPKDELLHIKWAKDIYSLEEANYLDYTELLVVPVSASIRPVASGAYADDDIFEEDSGSMVLDTDESYSSVNEEVINDVSPCDDPQQENPGDLIYSSVHSECSMQSNVMVMDSQRVMDKFDSLKQSQETKLAQYLQNINYDQKFGLQQKKNLSENIPGTVDEIVNLRKSELDEKSSIISAGSIQPHKKHKISEKSGSNEKINDDSSKRVSFHHFDFSFMYGEESLSAQPRREQLRSISDAHILKGFRSQIDENPLLSVLSCTDIKEKASRTVYTSMTDRIHALRYDKLAPFFKRIIDIKNMLLQLHWQNPGLFHTVIFTDYPGDCVNGLKDVARGMMTTLGATKNYKDPNLLKNHPDFQEVIKLRLANMKLHENPFTRIYEELKI